MANTLLTPTAVTREALRVLHQKLNFVGNVERQYDDSFAKSGAKIGDSLKIRLPNQYVVRTGATLTAQDTVESSTTLQIATQKGVDLNFTSADLTLSMQDFSTRIIKPAMSVLAAAIEADALSMYKDVYNSVSPAVTGVAAAMTFQTILQARKVLVDNLVPNGDRRVVLNTQDNVDLVDALKGLFQDSSEIASQYREGLIGRSGGFDWLENTLLARHTRGTVTGAFTTDTRTSALALTSVAVTSLTTTTQTGGGLLKGDVFTIQNVFRVHPETKATTNVLQQFAAAADSSGTTLTIVPPIVLAGAYQNVAIPTVSSAATFTILAGATSTYGISLAFHKEAFAFATADLVMPGGMDFASRQVLDGISMRIVRQYDISNDKFPCRLDVLYGYKTIRPQLAVRMAANAT